MLYIKKIAYYVIKLLIQGHLMFGITSHSITFDWKYTKSGLVWITSS